MKRYIYIILGIIVVAIVAIALLFWWKNSQSPATTGANGTTGTAGTLPVTGTQSNSSSSSGAAAQSEGGDVGTTGTTGGTAGTSNSGSATSFGVVDSDQVLNYFVDANNDIFAVNTDGSIHEVINGQSSELSASSTANIISASFSYDGKKILILSGSQSDPAAAVYTIASSTWTALPNGLVGAEWSPTNYQIAYLAPGKAGTTIGTINAASAKPTPTALATVNAQDLSLVWLSNNQMVLADKPSASVQTSILLFNTQTKAVTPLVVEESGLQSLWTTGTTSTGEFGLVFSGTAGGYTLQLASPTGTILEALNFLTLPSKCLFSNQPEAATSTTATSTTTVSPVLYCGVPRNESNFSAAHLPDDYDQFALFTSDNIYKIDLTSGAATILWNDQNQNMDASDLKFANNDLFFINRYDQKLYALTLQSASQ